MRKKTCLLLAVVIGVMTMPVLGASNLQDLKGRIQELKAETLAKFKDVKSGEWYLDSVSTLVAMGGITGYEDSTFRPTGTITRAEYTSIVARSLGLKAKDGVTGHWSAGIMAAATDAGLVKSGEFTEPDKAITRNEMARMAVRAVAYQNEAVPADYSDYASLMTDINASAAFKDDVTKVVAMGIISGYPDKTFQGTRTLSRAEASAVAIRILDKEARTVPGKPSATGTIQLGETKPLAEILPNNFNDPMLTISGYKTIALVDTAAYAPKTFTTGDNKTGIMFKGHCGNLVVIKDNMVLGYEGELFSPGQGYSLYSNSNWETADYFGFSTSQDATLRIIANPWKK